MNYQFKLNLFVFLDNSTIVTYLVACSWLPPVHYSECPCESEPRRSGRYQICEPGTIERTGEESRCWRGWTEAFTLVQTSCEQLLIQVVGPSWEGNSQWNCWHENHSQAYLIPVSEYILIFCWSFCVRI